MWREKCDMTDLHQLCVFWHDINVLQRGWNKAASLYEFHESFLTRNGVTFTMTLWTIDNGVARPGCHLMVMKGKLCKFHYTSLCVKIKDLELDSRIYSWKSGLMKSRFHTSRPSNMIDHTWSSAPLGLNVNFFSIQSPLSLLLLHSMQQPWAGWSVRRRRPVLQYSKERTDWSQACMRDREMTFDPAQWFNKNLTVGEY